MATIAVTARELERRLAGPDTAPELEDDARLIRRETDRCRQVLEAMAGQSGQPMGETPTASTVEDVFEAVRARLDAGDRDRLDVDVSDNVPVVWPTRVVVRAIGNLVRNALQASQADSRVRVEASRASSGLVRLAVVDRGHGMRPDNLARIGEPFFTTKPVGKGTGLGVFVARSSVEQLGGRMTVSSTVGHGTRVDVELPSNVVSSTADA